MTPNVQNLLVDLRTKERFRESENERLAAELRHAKATPQASRPGIRVLVRRGFGRLVPSI
jgi:hypothetical protein